MWSDFSKRDHLESPLGRRQRVTFGIACIIATLQCLASPYWIHFRGLHTTVATHCHCCNFLVSLEFAHWIYQRWKSSAGARRRPAWLRYNIFVLPTCHLSLNSIATPLLFLFLFSKSDYLFVYLQGPQFDPLALPGLVALPSVGRIFKLPLSLFAFSDFVFFLYSLILVVSQRRMELARRLTGQFLNIFPRMCRGWQGCNRFSCGADILLIKHCGELCLGGKRCSWTWSFAADFQKYCHVIFGFMLN